MSQGLDFTLTMDPTAAAAALEKLVVKQQKVEEAAKRVGGASKKAGDDAVKALSEWDKQLVKTAAGQAAAARNAESAWDRQLRITKAARDAEARALAEKLAGINKLRDARQREHNQTLAGGKQIAGNMDELASNTLAYLGTLASIGTVVTTVVGSYEQWLDVSKELLAVNLNLAHSQDEAVKNMAGVAGGTKSQLLNEFIPQMQQETGFPDQAKLAAALGNAYAASSDVELSKEAVDAAARLTRTSPDQLQAYSGAALDIMRASGEKEAENALGFMLEGHSISRVASPEKYAQNIPKVIAAASTNVKGDDDKEAAKAAASIFGTFSREAADVQGEGSRTASIQFLSQLREFYEQDENKKLDTGTVAGRVETLQQDEKLRAKFLKDYHGEAGFLAAAENIVTPGTKAAEDFKANIGNLHFDRKEYDALAEELQNATPQLALANADAVAKANEQGFGTSAEGVRRSIHSKAVEIGRGTVADISSGPGDYVAATFDQRLHEMRSYAGGEDPLDFQLRNLKSWEAGREIYKQRAEASGDAAGAARYGEQLQLLQRQIQVLEQMKTQLDELNKSNGKMANESKAPARTPGPNLSNVRR